MEETGQLMARTRDEQGQRILQAASELLSKEGASALSVRRIAAAAGCSTMGLYSRFGGKDGVIDELYAEGFERLVDGMKANVPTDDPVADLRRVAVCYRDTALANATHYMVMFGGAVPDFVPSDESHQLAARGVRRPRGEGGALHRRRSVRGLTRPDHGGALGRDPRVGDVGDRGYQPAHE